MHNCCCGKPLEYKPFDATLMCLQANSTVIVKQPWSLLKSVSGSYLLDANADHRALLVTIMFDLGLPKLASMHITSATTLPVFKIKAYCMKI